MLPLARIRHEERYLPRGQKGEGVHSIMVDDLAVLNFFIVQVYLEKIFIELCDLRTVSEKNVPAFCFWYSMTSLICRYRPHVQAIGLILV
ncbi:hypothetical protein Despr_2077 [Desulfobulbus propionicus DSM 2032]|uniref:Uncharacterized protein n=1 Tax=Desulfobulbus propionicus (strain ATCC 33891 / DSM 2032 / VKM B-1956 / 1pr3) TaxID=577650 RepID=A0A7U3YMQ5_DESPD|nr:hypothetical protein Despr_2077 [Desulfobulbus propionicus DSM 2032]